MKLAPILFVFISSVCVAQTGPPPPAPPPPPGLPIDGAIIFAVIFALFFGIKLKLDQLKKTKA